MKTIRNRLLKINLWFLFILILFIETENCKADVIVFNSSRDIIDFGLKNSSFYKMLHQEAMQNMNSAKMAFNGFLPKFSFSLSENDTINILSSDSRTKSIQFSVSQEIFDGGKKQLAYSVNKIFSVYAYKNYELVLKKYILELAGLYNQILVQKEKLIIQENLFDLANSNLAIIKKEVILGLSTETDYLEYYISCLKIEQEKEQLEHAIGSLVRKLKFLLELEEDSELLLVSDDFKKNIYSNYSINFDRLWSLIKCADIELKKMELEKNYSDKINSINKLWFVPSISLQGNINFSGAHYPLTQPKYSIKLSFDFADNSIIPVQIDTSYMNDFNKMKSFNNNLNISLIPDFSIISRMQSSKIASMQGLLKKQRFEYELKESIYELVTNYENAINLMLFMDKTIELMEKRHLFSRQQLASGEIKQLDYLKEELEIAELKIANIENKNKILTIEQNLELLANIPFGELKNVFK